jgi:AcrR family transcriptional regulator
MTISSRRPDRRIQRTRELLQQAFVDVLQEKGFAATSIHDITERANLNRGTFYLHFEDKYQLLDAVMREQFHKLITSHLPAAAGWDRSTLQRLIRAVLECLEGKYHHQPARLPVPAALLERAISEELIAILAGWLRRTDSHALPQIPVETIAAIVGSAIFGPALQWSQQPATVSPQQLTSAILLIIATGVGFPERLSS